MIIKQCWLTTIDSRQLELLRTITTTAFLCAGMSRIELIEMHLDLNKLLEVYSYPSG